MKELHGKLDNGQATVTSVAWLAIVPVTPWVAPNSVAASGAPWWETPLITGIAAVLGAAIAFGSTYLSDRRRLGREDLRQWDREIRDIYIAASALIRTVLAYRWSPLPPSQADMNHNELQRSQERYEEVRECQFDLENLAEQLRLFASDRTIESMDSVVESVTHIGDILHDNVRPSKYVFRNLSGLRGELLHSVQENLRLRSYRPYIRRPMTLRTKVRLWIIAMVDPTTNGELKWWQGHRFYWGAGMFVIAAVAIIIYFVRS